jgi:hypothetical protein
MERTGESLQREDTLKKRAGCFFRAQRLWRIASLEGKAERCLCELKDVATMLRAREAFAEQPSPNNLEHPGFLIEAYDEAVEKYRREFTK